MGRRDACLFCRHFQWSQGERGYSEYTPGSDSSMWCGKKHWELETCTDDERDVRRKLTMAQNCKDFEDCKA